MQNRKDVYGQVAGLVGDPYFDWLTPEYFTPLCNLAYEQAIMYLELSCSPYIEKIVMIPGVQVGVDETNLVPSELPDNTYPLKDLVEPRYVDFKTAGAPANQYKPVQECTILPDTPPQVAQGTFDIRVRGDFRPASLTTDESVIEIHPLAAHALAYSVGALIGMERPNEGWATQYGTMAKASWDVISAKLTQQQQHLPYRVGSPNRANNNRGRNQWNYNLQGNMGWEWRSFGLYLKLI